VHLEGCWEFPGGKCEEGEPHAACLEREIAEELDAPVRVGREVLAISHSYPDRTVELHFFACDLLGEARPVLGQEMRWVRRDELAALEFPPADRELIRMLSRGGKASQGS
jgi:8-oxo-dGTP diphosphatase